MISRDQVINRLRAERFSYQDRTKHGELYRQKSTSQRVNVPRRDILEPEAVRMILRQAGLSAMQVEDFMAGATKC